MPLPALGPVVKQCFDAHGFASGGGCRLGLVRAEAGGFDVFPGFVAEKKVQVIFRAVPCAALFGLCSGDGDDRIALVHVWGSARDRGVAQGTLMKEEIAMLTEQDLEEGKKRFSRTSPL